MNTTTQSIYMEKQATKTTCFSGSKAVIETLLREGVDTVFGYPGGTIMPVYDLTMRYTTIGTVSTTSSYVMNRGHYMPPRAMPG